MNEDESKDLIKRYIHGEVSQQEGARLETWYLLKAEDASDDFEPDYPVAGMHIWERISNGIGPQSAGYSLKEKNTFKKYYWYSVAAAILICFGLSILYYKSVNKVPDHFAVEPKNDISPGNNNAILILSDGSRISLNEKRQGLIHSEKGTEIIKEKNGQISYRVNIFPNTSPQYNTIETPSGGQYAVVLSDGSKVWLNSKSSLRYPTKFAENNRQVFLQGEAYFEIAHRVKSNGKTAVPFIVNTIHGKNIQELKVLGTHFNINGYEDEPSIVTTLLIGRVAIYSQGKSVELKPGQQARLDKSALTVSAADIDMAVAWKEGEFVFRESLESAMRKVARWYGVEVSYKNSAPKDLLLGGWISKEKNISNVLDHIQSTGKVHFKLEGRRVIVSD